jgi:branched-chain amino acid aminotransferase
MDHIRSIAATQNIGRRQGGQETFGRLTMATVPFDSRDGEIWYDGTFVDWKDAKVHVLTHGLHYASAVFEGERAYGGQIFKLREHTERLIESGRILGFTIPYSADEIDEACREALRRTGLKDAYIRPIAWRGSEMMGVSAQANTIHLAIAAWEWPSYFRPEERLKGIRLDIADYRRPDPRTAPCRSKAAGLYMICTISKHAAEAKGYADAMMYDYREYVAEATGANIFFVRDGVLHTPTPDCFLDGITRQTVIALARRLGMEVVERHITGDELPTFSECFICGTAAEVTPVSEIGPHHFQPGAISETLMNAYSAEVQPRSAAAE